MGVFVFFGEFGYVLDHREKDFGCLCENFCVGVFVCLVGCFVFVGCCVGVGGVVALPYVVKF